MTMSRQTSPFTHVLHFVTRLCCRSPVSVLVFGFLVAALSVFGATQYLGFKMSRLDLINPESSFNQLWLDYLDEFGDNNEVIVVVEGKSNVEIIPIMEDLSARIASFPDLFRGALHGVDISAIRRKGLHYVPVQELQLISEFIADAAKTAKGDWNHLRVDAKLQELAQNLQNAQNPLGLLKTVKELDAFSLSLSKAFSPTPSYGSPWGTSPSSLPGPQAAVPDIVAACSQNGTSYFLFPTDSGVMGFVLLSLAEVDKTQLAQGKESIEKLRSLIAEAREKSPNVQIGLTGMPIIENDEMQISSDAMTKASILAFIGVGAIFMAGFGGIRHPVLAMVALLAAFAWTMGYVVLAVGHLNILSISFGAMLIGLGTDFSVHYVARYLDLRRVGKEVEEALCETAAVIGPGILTGALTTAAAFFMASFTEFTGIAELGMISGGGVLLCALATFILLPAMIQLMDGSKSQPTPLSLPTPLDIRPAFALTWKMPRVTLFIFVGLAIVIALGTKKVWYDHNLLHLQPDGLESVELEQRLLNMNPEKGGKNVWFALSLADSEEELLARKQQFQEKYPELTVEEIVSWFPKVDSAKVALIAEITQSLQNLPERPAPIDVPLPENVGNALGTLQQILANPQNPLRQMARAKDVSTTSTLPAEMQKYLNSLENLLPSVLQRLAETRAALRRLSPQEYQNRMTQYQSAVAGDLLTQLRMLAEMASPEPPTFEDLPQPLVERFVGRHGKHLMRIYTTANIWNMEEMKKFVSAVREIDPGATGSPLQTYEASLLMQKGYVTAAMYAFIVVVLLIFLDFRNVKDVVFAMIPMSVGFLLMFGILGWLNIPLNPANMIVLPLILGIGIDDGVHLMHDYRARRGAFKISRSTALSVLTTSLTTMIGFGSMMIASHKGLQSLGRVLVIGVGCCMLTSLVVLPALLSFWSKNEKERDDKLSAPESASDRLRNEHGVFASEHAQPVTKPALTNDISLPDQEHWEEKPEKEPNRRLTQRFVS